MQNYKKKIESYPISVPAKTSIEHSIDLKDNIPNILNNHDAFLIHYDNQLKMRLNV